MSVESSPLLTCRACGCGELDEALSVRRQGAVHRFLRCRACDSVNLAHSPDFAEVEQVHGAGQYHGEARAKFPAALERALEWIEARRGSWVARTLAPGARVLDVGCGRGVMAAALQARGFEVSVSELNAAAAEGAVRRGVKRVLTGPSALDAIGEGTLDAVTMFHSLEHMVEPARTLGHLSRLLRPGGQLFVEVPLLSVLARSFGSAWFHLDPPRHMVLFTAQGLRACMTQTGFQMRESHSFSLEFSAPSLFLSVLGMRAGSDGLYASAHVTAPGRLKRVAAAATIVAGSALALFPAALLAAAGLGDVFRARFEVTPS